MKPPISYSDAHSNLDQLCVCEAWLFANRVVETGEAVIIARPDGHNVALMSEAELSSLLETLYLLRWSTCATHVSPTNASRLKTALNRSKQGTVPPQSIDELSQRLGLDDEVDESVAVG